MSHCSLTLDRYVASNMTFMIKTPISPLTIVSAEARLSLTEFVVYILGQIAACHLMSSYSFLFISL